MPWQADRGPVSCAAASPGLPRVYCVLTSSRLLLTAPPSICIVQHSTGPRVHKGRTIVELKPTRHFASCLIRCASVPSRAQKLGTLSVGELLSHCAAHNLLGVRVASQTRPRNPRVYWATCKQLQVALCEAKTVPMRRRWRAMLAMEVV